MKGKTNTKAKPATRPKAGTKARSIPKTRPAMRPKAATKARTASKAKPTTKAKAGVKARTASRAKPVTRARTASKAKPATRAKAGMKAKPAARAKAVTKSGTAPRANTVARAVPQAHAPVQPIVQTIGQPEAYRDRTKSLLDEWSAEINQLRIRAQMLIDMGARSRALARVDELQRNYYDALRQFSERKIDSGEKLEQLRATFRDTSDRTRKAIEDLRVQAY